MSSEDILGLSNPIKHQCPTIDTYVKKAKELTGYVNDLGNVESLEEVVSIYKDLDWDIGDVEGNFENLRNSCAELREWGQQWKGLAKLLMDKHYPEWEDESSEDWDSVQSFVSKL